MKEFVLLCLLFAFAVSVPVNLYEWSCTNTTIVGTVGQPIEPVTCTCTIKTANRDPRFNPQLPSGLSYTLTVSGFVKTVVISGTPMAPQQLSVYSIGYKEYVSQIRIGVIGQATSLSYGFDYMYQYVDVTTEPIPARSDAFLNDFRITPALPNGVTIDATTGTIRGKFPDTSSTDVVYTVTATNGVSTVTTTLKFIVKEQSEMVTNGYTGCYWSGTTECRTPAFDYYYENTAQYCQHEIKFEYTDSYSEGAGNTWPGLDERFRDYYTSYFYGYLNILVPGQYTFAMASDDASLLYVKDIDESNPLINRDGCRGSSTDYGYIDLEKGRHLFVVKFLEVNGAATLSLRISSVEAGIDQIVDNTLTKVGGRGPTFVTYPLVTGYVNAELKVIVPEMVSGGASSWTVDPPLPSGFALDPNRGEIRGKPTAIYNGFHTVTAVGTNGAAKATVHIVIADTPLAGFRAKYYKIIDSEVCMYSSYAPSQVELKVQKVDAQINYPTSIPGVWEGLPTDFTSYYYAEWEGYLHFEEIGNWKLRLGCRQMCRLWSIEDTIQIDLWKNQGTGWGGGNYCMTTYTTSEKVFPVSSVGYYYMKIRYSLQSGDKGIVLEWQAPTGNWEVVPAEKIFHIAPSMLSYEYEQSHYFKNVEIVENKPLLFHATTCSNYRVTPALPEGLSIQPTTGIISGTPSNEQIETIYTVTCTSNEGDLTTKVLMDVFYVLPPTGLTLMYNGVAIGNNLITLIPATAISMITVSGDTDAISYTISPALPNGLNLDAASGTISGTPVEPRAETVYSITARSAGGILPLTLRLAVSGCKGVDNGVAWENEFVIVDVITGPATITVKKGSNVVQCSTGSFDSNGNAVMQSCIKNSMTAGSYALFCMKSDTDVKIEVTCTSEYGCYTQTRRPNGNRWPTRYTYDPQNQPPFTETYDYPTQLTPLTAVTLSTAETTVYTGNPMNTVEIYPNGCYKEITIEPSLGLDNMINLANPVINGNVNGYIKTVFTITAKGDAGTASTTLTVHFEECGIDGKSASLRMALLGTSYANEMSYEIYLGDATTGRQVFSIGPNAFSNNIEYSNTICAESGNYEVIMRDSWGDAWATGSYLKMYDVNGNLVQEFSFDIGTGMAGNKEKHGFFTVAAATGTEWKILTDKKPDKEWNTVGFDDSDWSTPAPSSEQGTWSQNTIYLRTVINVEEAIKYPLVQFGILYKDGMIVYLNGNEVYRRNMPSGTVNTRTYANGMFDGYYQRVGSAPGYLLQDGNNVLAVEIHRHSTTSGTILFRGYANALQGDCISRVDGGSITESAFFNQPDNSAAQAWDRDIGTEWIENGLPAWTIYSYNFDRMEWVNRLSIVSNAGHPDRDPISIRLSGSTDGVNWDELYAYENKNMFSARRERKNFMMMDHMNSYSKYKFEMMKAREEYNKVSLSVIDVMSCQLNYCVKDSTFPGVMSDEISVAPCPENYIGEMYRQCSLAALKPSWGEIDRTECRSTIPPKNTVYVDVAYSITELNVETTRAMASMLTTTFAAASEVGLGNIEMWKVKDVSSEFPDASAASAFYIRVTVKDEIASQTLKKVTECTSTFQNALTEYHKDELPAGFDLQIYMKPILQERKGLGALSVALIIILVILVLIVASVVAFWIWVRTKSKKSKNGARQLRSAAGRVNAQHLSGSKDVRV